MSEQDIRDTLFEAGYTVESINNMMEAKDETRNDSTTSSIESEIFDSAEGENAFEVLKKRIQSWRN